MYQMNETIDLLKEIFDEYGHQILESTNDFPVLVRDYLSEAKFEKESQILWQRVRHFRHWEKIA